MAFIHDGRPIRSAYTRTDIKPKPPDPNAGKVAYNEDGTATLMVPEHGERIELHEYPLRLPGDRLNGCKLWYAYRASMIDAGGNSYINLMQMPSGRNNAQGQLMQHFGWSLDKGMVKFRTNREFRGTIFPSLPIGVEMRIVAYVEHHPTHGLVRIWRAVGTAAFEPVRIGGAADPYTWRGATCDGDQGAQLKHGIYKSEGGGHKAKMVTWPMLIATTRAEVEELFGKSVAKPAPAPAPAPVPAPPPDRITPKDAIANARDELALAWAATEQPVITARLRSALDWLRRALEQMP